MKTIAVLALLLASLSSIAAENKISYPERAWYLDQKGYIEIVYDIDARGIPENVRVVDAKPKSIFNDSVKEQIYKWRFEPGQPAKNVRVKIVFEKPENH